MELKGPVSAHYIANGRTLQNLARGILCSTCNVCCFLAGWRLFLGNNLCRQELVVARPLNGCPGFSLEGVCDSGEKGHSLCSTCSTG